MNLPDDAPVTEPATALPTAPAPEPDPVLEPDPILEPAPPLAVVSAIVHDPDPLHIPHEDHDHDPSNPHYFGLPVGVIIAAVIATISVAITILKFFH